MQHLTQSALSLCIAKALPSAMKSSLIFEASKFSRNAPAQSKVNVEVHMQRHSANAILQWKARVRT